MRQQGQARDQVPGFRQFDAPVCVIITCDRVLDGSDDTPFDCGAVATALVNAAWPRGLGAVTNSQASCNHLMREHAGIADDQVIIKSIAPGWPDETFLIYDRTAAIMFSSIGAPRGSSATPMEVRA